MTTEQPLTSNNKADVAQPVRRRRAKVAPIQAISRSSGQGEFLEAVAKVDPDVLKSLYDGPYQLLAKMNWPKLPREELAGDKNKTVADFDKGLQILSAAHEAAQSEINLKALQHRRELRALRDSVDEWANRWNLTDPWCKEAAIRTLIWWRVRGLLSATAWWFRTQTHADRLASVPSFTFAFPSVEAAPPDFYAETRLHYINRLHANFQFHVDKARKSFNDKLEDYVLGVEKSIGFPKPKPRQLRKGGRKHFIWLAGFQVLGWKYGKISKALGIDEISTIRKPINGLANLIGLTLRSASKSEPTQDADTICKILTKWEALYHQRTTTE
jgi:hypothetical protein